MSLCNKSKDKMTTTTITLSQALAARTTKHNEAISLMSKIESAQQTIEAMQDKLNKMNTAVSYYKAVADVYLSEIEEQAAIRSDAVCEYQKIMWSLYKAKLPLISNTGIQEMSVTLYSAYTAQA